MLDYVPYLVLAFVFSIILFSYVAWGERTAKKKAEEQAETLRRESEERIEAAAEARHSWISELRKVADSLPKRELDGKGFYSELPNRTRLVTLIDGSIHIIPPDRQED